MLLMIVMLMSRDRTPLSEEEIINESILHQMGSTNLLPHYFVDVLYLLSTVETWYKPVPPQRPHNLRPQWLFLPQFAISPEHCSVSMSRAIFKEFSMRAVCQLDDQCRGPSHFQLWKVKLMMFDREGGYLLRLHGPPNKITNGSN